MGLIFIILIGVAIYFLYNNQGNFKGFSNKKSGEEIILERFANGEIDEETYRRMKDALRK